MKQKFLPLLAVVPLFVVSCKEKTASPAGAEAKAAPAADAPVILAKRGFLPPAGTKAALDLTIAMENASMQIDAGGQQMEGTADQSSKTKETLEFLAGEQIRRTIVSKKTTGKMVINGMDQPIPMKSEPLEGLPVLLTKKDGKWTAALENGSTPEAALLPEIERMVTPFAKEQDVETYGETPRKVGDKWNVDPSNIGSFGDAENLTGTYAIEFLRIEDFQGTPCAVLKGVIDLKGQTPSENGKHMGMRFRGDVTSHRSLKDMTDLQSITSGTVDFDGAPAPGVTIHIEGPMKITQKVAVTRP